MRLLKTVLGQHSSRMVLSRLRCKFLNFACATVTCFAVTGAMGGANLGSADPDGGPTPDPVEKKVDELRIRTDTLSQ